ncbi:hypothetical protein MESS2_350059 [Mesorhizobium metallidurans STM 2683]|uniref:Uncharacterized protein n=1 Tax=Mesorhizobium metallidurans STM 2683 TaxID=1297569 RepID=M5EQU0_9HYPH|nr:hypothetical protein MESS2_350059 [Mesorhizobium metallidurans STM 2683]
MPVAIDRPRLVSPHAARPVPANMTDPTLREFKPGLNHHIRLSRDTMREQSPKACRV